MKKEQTETNEVKSSFDTKEELIESFIKSGSVVNIKDKFLLKTPLFGKGWDLYEIKKTEKNTYAASNIGYNMNVKYAISKVIEIVIKNKYKNYNDLNEFLNDYKRIEKTLINILP